MTAETYACLCHSCSLVACREEDLFGGAIYFYPVLLLVWVTNCANDFSVGQVARGFVVAVVLLGKITLIGSGSLQRDETAEGERIREKVDWIQSRT